jgi:aryl-alcohol dehydrogenase-like predicted oxidoreductase
MNYRSLGRTGVKVSPLCFGTMLFGDKTSEADAGRMVDGCLERGINFFDTANVYVRGKSEEVLGRVLKTRGNRDRLVLATKVHGRMDDDDPNAQGNSRRHIIAECEASLRRLGIDYIDLYQIHRPQSSIPIDETLRALDDLIRAGKVRYIGSSTYAPWQVVESIWIAKELGLNRFVSEQPPYHVLDRRIERELVPVAQQFGLALLPWSPLAGGLLTGKYSRDKRPKDSRFNDRNEWTERHFTDDALTVVDRMTELAESKDCTVSQLALAWAMDQPGITSPIIGPRTMEQLEDNLGALDVEITDEDREAIDSFTRPGGEIVNYFDADFGPARYAVLP